MCILCFVGYDTSYTLRTQVKDFHYEGCWYSWWSFYLSVIFLQQFISSLPSHLSPHLISPLPSHLISSHLFPLISSHLIPLISSIHLSHPIISLPSHLISSLLSHLIPLHLIPPISLISSLPSHLIISLPSHLISSLSPNLISFIFSHHSILSSSLSLSLSLCVCLRHHQVWWSRIDEIYSNCSRASRWNW
jgi:hypothetical protein